MIKGLSKAWCSGALALVCCLGISGQARATEDETEARVVVVDPRHGWHAQFRWDWQAESHGPEGVFWGPTFGGGLVHWRPHDFIGARFYMQLYALPHEVETQGVTFRISQFGWRLGLTAGREVSEHVWLLGELMPQYEITTVRAVSAQPPLQIKDGGGSGFGMMASFGVGWDAGRLVMYGLSATLAVPFDRHPYNVFDEVARSQKLLFSAWALQPGVSLTIGFF